MFAFKLVTFSHHWTNLVPSSEFLNYTQVEAHQAPIFTRGRSEIVSSTGQSQNPYKSSDALRFFMFCQWNPDNPSSKIRSWNGNGLTCLTTLWDECIRTCGFYRVMLTWTCQINRKDTGFARSLSYRFLIIKSDSATWILWVGLDSN